MVFRRIDKSKLKPKFFNEWIFKDINDYSHRYDVFYGGGGSGKSYGAVQKVILKSIGNKRKVLVVRKVGNTLRFSIFTLFKSVLNSINIPYSENKTDMTIILPNESEFIFKGIDDPEKIKSITDITDIVIEEATELTEDDFTQLDIRLRPGEDIKYPQITLMFNPVSKGNWCYKHWFENGAPKKAKVIHTTYKNNKFLTKDYIETLESLIDTNPAYYKIYCLGEFATLDKLIYPKFKTEEMDHKELLRSGYKAYFGLDFGYVNDNTALICVAVNEKEKELYIFDEYCKTGMLNDEIANMIEYKGYSKEVITADSAEKKSIDDIKRLGIRRIKPAVKGPDSIINGIQFIQQFKISAHPKCINTITELQNYTWKKDRTTNEYINEPIDDFNHCLDALRYAVEGIKKKHGILVLK